MSSSVRARNEIQSENQRQEENKTRKEDKNQTIHRNKDKNLLLNKSSKKNNNGTESSFNLRSLQRSRSPIRWRAGSPIRRGAGPPNRRRAGSPIREVSRNTCLLKMDSKSISKLRFPSFRKKQWRRSTYKSSRRSVLWTDDGILKIVVR